jgi:PKHD-type hydroxylase
MVHNLYWLWDGVLSKEFCDYVLGTANWDESKGGTVAADNTRQVLDPNMRITDIIWEDPMQPIGCVAQAYIQSANMQAEWGYPLSGFEKVQLGKYKAENKGHYDWHIDTFAPTNDIQRKLSISILLSDPSEFEGGELQFKGIEDRKILVNRGSVVVFPSFVEHRVTPVTKGVRYSAVTWASGPAFR